MFSRRTNRTHEARVYSNDGPIRLVGPRRAGKGDHRSADTNWRIGRVGVHKSAKVGAHKTVREQLVLELNSPVAERLNKGLMDKPQLRRFFGVRKYLGGELSNSPVVERRNNDLMS
eukprot:1183123-Prorocentrum_minimum.AAC.7